MKLKVGDLVVFKKYEDMTDEERSGIIIKESFPKFGKISEIYNATNGIQIEEEPYCFSQGSIDYVINNNDADNIRTGDEVLVKATVKDTFNEFAELIPLVKKSDVLKKIKRKEPEHFIVQEDYYGMYIGPVRELVPDKIGARIYTSRNAANEDAADMHLNAWDVIPYDN